MRRSTLDQLTDAQSEGRALVRAVDLSTGEERLIEPSPDTSALVRQAAAAARADKSGIVEVEGRAWFLGVHNPRLDLVIVGAVHIAQLLSQMATMADFGVRIIDPRAAFATEARFPGVSLSHDWPDEALQKRPLGFRSALVALTHDPKIDDPALTAALASPCFYVGALGSKKNHAGRIERLKSLGISDDKLARIHGPIGLAIGAKSPGEIAVSILGEIIHDLRASRPG